MAHRDYAKKYPSVTTILDVLSKKGLEYYWKSNTPEFIEQESAKSKAIGTQVHEVFQKHIEAEKITFETEYPEEVKNIINSFFKFKQEYPNVKLKRAELKMESDKYGVNGTCDCIAHEDNQLVLLDWKSSKCYVGEVVKTGVHKGESKEIDKPKIYPEYLYQTVWYSYLYYDVFKEPINKCRIVVMAKDKVAYDTITIDDRIMANIFQNACLPALQLFNVQKEIKSILKGE